MLHYFDNLSNPKHLLLTMQLDSLFYNFIFIMNQTNSSYNLSFSKT